MEFFSEMQIDQRAAEAIARGLFAVAKSDGMHPREAALIGSFWLETGGSPTALAALSRGADITPRELASLLHGDERALFMKTAILLAWADGKVTAAERVTLNAFAAALAPEIDAARLRTLEDEVKEFLVGHVAHLANSEAVAKVAKGLSN